MLYACCTQKLAKKLAEEAAHVGSWRQRLLRLAYLKGVVFPDREILKMIDRAN